MEQVFEFDFSEAVKRLIRYLLEGIVVGIAVQLIAHKKINLSEIMLIGVTASAVLSLCDSFSPTVAFGVRQGAGMGLGLNAVGYGGRFVPPM